MSKELIRPRPAARVLDLLPPFPIVLVTTRSNVITINQIHYFTFSPLRIGIAVAPSRYTHSLLRKEGEFVVNVPDASLVEAVKVCGSVSGRDGDKFKAAGLDRERASEVHAVGIRQCGASIECRVAREIEFEERTWFIGEVVSAQKEEGHLGTASLMCGRHEYVIPGSALAPR